MFIYAEPEAESWKSAIEQAISGHGGNGKIAVVGEIVV